MSVSSLVCASAGGTGPRATASRMANQVASNPRMETSFGAVSSSIRGAGTIAAPRRIRQGGHGSANATTWSPSLVCMTP
jgi:hypothetical protein